MSKTGRSLNRVALVVLAAVLFVAVNILSTSLLTSARLDLTADRLYSLSAGTRGVLARLDEPVTLRFFYSAKLATPHPALKSYGERVRNLLEEYESLARGKIRLEVIDPEPFSTAEDDAVAAGLTGVPTASGETLYFGLVGSGSVELERAIPYFAPEREQFLEYDLTKLVADLATVKKPVLGLLSSLPLEYGPGGPLAAAQGRSAPYMIYEQLSQSYTIHPLEPVFSAIPPEVDLLVIAHPAELGAEELYAIDQFVLGGGKALVFVDPYLESAAMMQSMQGMQGLTPGLPGETVPTSSALPALFAAWGVAFDETKVVADRQYAQRVSLADAAGGRSLKDYVLWLALPAAAMNENDPVTAELKAINMATAGALAPLAGATTLFEPLLTSSAESMLLDTADVRLNPDPDDLLRRFKADGERRVLAARITGRAASAFKEAPPGAPTAKQVTAAGVNVIIVADADLLEDQYWVQVQSMLGQAIGIPIADNGPFVINAVDNLSGSSDLISLRSRGVSRRPFTVVEAIQRRAEAHFLAEEQQLQARLSEAERRIRDLEQGPATGDIGRSQAAEIEAFRQDMLQTRKELRDVQHNLRRDIDRLGTVVKAVNIAGMPILVAIAALVLAEIRRRRRIGAKR